MIHIFDDNDSYEKENDPDLNEDYRKQYAMPEDEPPPLYDFKSDSDDELPPLPKWEFLLFTAAVFRTFLPIFLPFILLLVGIYWFLSNV